MLFVTLLGYSLYFAQSSRQIITLQNLHQIPSIGEAVFAADERKVGIGSERAVETHRVAALVLDQVEQAVIGEGVGRGADGAIAAGARSPVAADGVDVDVHAIVLLRVSDNATGYNIFCYTPASATPLTTRTLIPSRKGSSPTNHS